ncbi:aminoglycoside phosphotransferase family protein [Pontivivens ytuae]|uniref:Phosphotransferase n=1 Tax=Pontivivens ytuae TaxID=2789856 RepID=A0A7S9LQ97_9RHOB|nr:phosphotransferase [Pontivivens ytuae]QPH52755.1 phosphotransferase [Pontivivens ytuae]
MTPEPRIAAFLERAGHGGAPCSMLAGDASNRRYLRVGGMVLMDAPAEKGEDVRPFLDVTRRLRAGGFSAPEVLAEDAEAGLLLLEDLGDALFARVTGRVDEVALYEAAVDALAGIQADVSADGLPPYDEATYLREARLLTDWYLPARGVSLQAAEIAAYEALVAEACAALKAAPVIVLRDYHAENLLWLPERAGAARVGLLDYQDALAGHPAYDVVSLLEDARRDTSEELQKAMIRRFLDRTGASEEAFARAYAVLGAQRNLKIIGIFSRLDRRDGKPAYLAHQPRVWAHLQRDLAHPALAGLRAWVARHVPAPEAVTA